MHRWVCSVLFILFLQSSAVLGSSKAGRSKSSGSGRLKRLVRPDPPVRGIHFQPDGIDLSSCTRMFFDLLVKEDEPDEFATGALYCARIGRRTPPLVHCSVLLKTESSTYIQMHLTPYPPGNAPEKLLVECRPVAPNREAAAAQAGRENRIKQFLENDEVHHEDGGLTSPYTAYPPGGIYAFDMTRGVDIKLKSGIAQPSVVGAAYLWVRTVPGFFQLLMHDCQTFATQFLNVFTVGEDKRRVNTHMLASAFLKTFYKKRCRFASHRDEFANEASIASLQALLDEHFAAQRPQMDLLRVPSAKDVALDVPPKWAEKRKPSRVRIAPAIVIHDAMGRVITEHDSEHETENESEAEIRPASPVFYPLRRTVHLDVPRAPEPASDSEEERLIVMDGYLVDGEALRPPPPLPRRLSSKKLRKESRGHSRPLLAHQRRSASSPLLLKSATDSGIGSTSGSDDDEPVVVKRQKRLSRGKSYSGFGKAHDS